MNAFHRDVDRTIGPAPSSNEALRAMRKRLVSACLTMLAVAAFAMPAMADDSGPVYLLLVNTSSHPFRITGTTLGGHACPDCADRTIAPGQVTMVRIGELGSSHLTLAITGGGSGTCKYDISSSGSSENGDCGSSPKIRYATGVHSDFMFSTNGTPTFELFYAYDPVQGK